MSGGDVTDRDPNPTGQLINRQISHQHHVAPALSDMTLSPSPTLKDQFFESCNRNVLYKVRDSLGLGANVNWKRDPDGYSGLHNAAYHNYGEFLELLLKWSKHSQKHQHQSELVGNLHQKIKGMEKLYTIRYFM